MMEKNKMDRKNMWFFIVLGLLILASVAVTFYRYVILKDYQITAQVSCDPKTEVCFQTECDSTVEGSGCATAADGTSVSYYKMISKSAASIFACKQTTDKIGCDAELSCTSGEVKCSYEYCTEDALSDGVICTSPNN